MSEGESLMMKTARAFLKETIRSARTLEFSLPIRRMPSLRTSAGPTFLGCLRRLENLFLLASRREENPQLTSTFVSLCIAETFYYSRNNVN